jgi:hypothetical protein
LKPLPRSLFAEGARCASASLLLPDPAFRGVLPRFCPSFAFFRLAAQEMVNQDESIAAKKR